MKLINDSELMNIIEIRIDWKHTFWTHARSILILGLRIFELVPFLVFFPRFFGEEFEIGAIHSQQYLSVIDKNVCGCRH